MYKLFTFLLAALASLSCSVSRAQQFKSAQLDSPLTALAVNQKMMGSLPLSHNGNVFYSRAFGYAQAEGPALIAATTGTRYRVGSLSKMFTATMIMQLIEENKLTPNTPLATFFPQLPNAQAITIDQLLSHHSGLHNFTDDEAYEGYKTQPKTQVELLAIMAQAKADFEPGANYVYSNAGYVVLSYIVEHLTKLPYAQALRKRVLGFWQMGGSGQPLLAWQQLGSFTTDLCARAVGELSQGVRGPRCWYSIMPRFIGRTWCKTGYSSGLPRDLPCSSYHLIAPRCIMGRFSTAASSTGPSLGLIRATTPFSSESSRC